MRAKEKPHDPGRDQRLNQQDNRVRLNKQIIPVFKRSINRKARSPWLFTSWQATTNHGNAHPSFCRIRLFFFYSALLSMSKNTAGRAKL